MYALSLIVTLTSRARRFSTRGYPPSDMGLRMSMGPWDRIPADRHFIPWPGAKWHGSDGGANTSFGGTTRFRVVANHSVGNSPEGIPSARAIPRRVFLMIRTLRGPMRSNCFWAPVKLSTRSSAYAYRFPSV